MRFMIIVKATADSEAGVMPSNELIEAMGRFNEKLINAGVLVTAEGLQASSKGTRVKYSKGRHTVTDGPFAEAKELIAGFWIVDVKSKDEAIEWARRMPNPYGEGAEGEIEVRQLFELDDFEPSEAIEKHFRGKGFAQPE